MHRAATPPAPPRSVSLDEDLAALHVALEGLAAVINTAEHEIEQLESMASRGTEHPPDLPLPE